MTRVLAKNTTEYLDQIITVSGWVHTRRDHGGLIFIDLRDESGIVQLLVSPDNAAVFAAAEAVRDEYVISASGTVKSRDENLVNDKLDSGAIEIVVENIEVLNKSETLPIQPFAEAQANEDLRLKYRYLDLRRPKMQNMLRQRAGMYRRIRQFMEQLDFIEIATPILANSSPEGARDFLIPARLHENKFYALPQAPQQFKQLLMVGGVPRYYQLAACFRDEDPRADRLYGEFYQLDLEMSFVSDGEEVRSMIDPLIENLVTDFAKKQLMFEHTPRMTYAQAMEKYGSDKPDLRFGMELIDLTETFKDSEFGVFKSAISSGGAVKAICVKNGASLSRKMIDKFTETAKNAGAGGLAYIKYSMSDSGNLTAESPIVKFLTDSELAEIESKLDVKDGDAVFFGADKRAIANTVLGRLRSEFAEYFELKDPNKIALAWIIDFPFYELDSKTNKLDFGHNPFSMPKGGLETLRNTDDKIDIVADQYDMVMNGYEICSGGVRNHNPDILYEVFAVLGFDKQYVEDKFGAMLNAFKFGAPPHAGCAFGVDRMLMELLGEQNVREVVAFPKNGSGVDLMMYSPTLVDDTQKKELHLR